MLGVKHSKYAGVRVAKKCGKCGETKALGQFASRKRSSDGKQAWCRVCANKAGAHRYGRSEQSPPSTGTKACTTCQVTQSVAEFASHKMSADGLQSRCRRCRWVSRMGKEYGLSAERHQRMYVAQEGKCAVCAYMPDTIPPAAEYHWKTKLVVDHNHDTGAVRDLLCHHCNTGQGFLAESVRRLSQMARYVLKHKKSAKLDLI